MWQVGDTLDGLLEELHYLQNQVEHADPIAANPDALREQINENNVRTGQWATCLGTDINANFDHTCCAR